MTTVVTREMRDGYNQFKQRFRYMKEGMDNKGGRVLGWWYAVLGKEEQKRLGTTRTKVRLPKLELDV